MNEFGNGRSSRPWNLYQVSSDIVEASPPRVEDHQGRRWTNFGETSSMNAVSFGFVATAILISMFVIMAIVEHFYRRNLSTSQDGVTTRSLESSYANKTRNNHDMELLITNAKELTVVMPGQKYPTSIAQPSPLLLSSPRHGFRCSSHLQPSFAFS